VSANRRIAVIGGGASGALASLHCWRQAGDSVDIVVIDPSPHLGHGRAYSTKDTEYLLNVPVGNMSAFPDDPSDFERWVIQFDPEIRNSRYWPYLPRKYFGAYLESHLNKIPERRLLHVRSRVASVSTRYGSYCLTLENQSTIEADDLIVATGYRHSMPSSPALNSSKHVIQASALEVMGPEEISGRVLIVGSGLTAIDVWKRLRKCQKVKDFTFISRRGLVPLTHDAHIASHAELPSFQNKTPLQILKLARDLKERLPVSWPEIAHKIRSEANDIWQNWHGHHKAQFLQHLKPYWEILRHRMPGAISEELSFDIQSQRAKILSGRILQIQSDSYGAVIEIRHRKSHQFERLRADWIVMATGSVIDQTLFNESYVQGIECCPYGFGYLNNDAPNLWLIGPASKSRLWEITAIPDIRIQAVQIAQQLTLLRDYKIAHHENI